MPIELKVPQVGESITEVQIGAWLKSPGDVVQQDDPVVEIESDKATLELPAPVNGTITRILKDKGQTAGVGEVIGFMDEQKPGEKPAKAASSVEGRPPASPETPVQKQTALTQPQPVSGQPRVMPAAARLLSEHNLDADAVAATGPGGRLLKEDVVRHVLQAVAPPEPVKPAPAPATTEGSRQEEIVPMSPMRQRIADRLVQAQQNAALLTTFNEIDMTEVMALRQQYREEFQQHYGVKLGFMSFFVKAAIDALKQFPQVNAEIRDNNIVYRNFYDIGIAVGGGKGLVVPILRNAELMSFAAVEIAINDFAARAKENKIDIEELKGGTFTITNGGVYGSLLSTPIVNPPQSGILGLHAIQERPVARDSQVVIRPMMYVALTYDHRVVDGREAVTFLLRVKECIENPSRMLLEV